MKISWNYLNQFIDLANVNVIDITEQLILAGLEIENISYHRNLTDTIFEISLTANRQDITGFIHIAKEVAALLQKPFTINIKDERIKANSMVYIIEHICYDNKQYILELLKQLNIEISHSFLDQISLINLKWGQQLTAYRIKTPYELFQKKDKTTLQFFINKSDQVSCSEPIEQLYVKNIQAGENIQNIIIVDHGKYNAFSKYAIEDLFKNLNVDKKDVAIYEILSNKQNTKSQDRNTIECNFDKINQVLGPMQNNYTATTLSRQNIIKILQRLDFNTLVTKNSLRIEIPQERSLDLKQEIDIIEEIGRIYGFNKFLDKIPSFNHNYLDASTSQITQKIRRILRLNGLHEVIGYSFQNTETFEKYHIINPLNQDQNVLRNNLVENLIKLKIHNSNQNNGPFEVFEIGNIFIQDVLQPLKTYRENLHLCCLMGNGSFNKLTWQDKNTTLTWFQAKGQIEELFEKLNTNISWSNISHNHDFTKSIVDYIHPTRSIYIKNKTHTIGVLSELNYRKYNYTNINHNIYFFEIDVIKLSKTIQAKNQLDYRYFFYPCYPKSTRDLSIKIKNFICLEKINNILSSIKQDITYMIESIKIVNEYYHSQEYKTICFRISYRSFTKTLTNIEVDKLSQRFKEKLDEMMESKT